MSDFKFMLAPIEYFTNSAFRTLCYRHGADLTFTELARVDALARRNSSTLARLNIPDSTPTIIQLLCANELKLESFLSSFSPQPGFQGFNLNLGCPSPNIVKLGLGCALIKRVSKVSRLVNIIRNNNFPVSIKLRLGLNSYERSHKTYLNLINNIDADFFVVHARDGSQTYQDRADFSVYSDCVKTGKKIIANGDISSIDQINYLKSVGVSGVMIGRYAIIDPSIFSRLKDPSCSSISSSTLFSEYLALAKSYNVSERYIENIKRFIGNSSLVSNLRE